MTCPPPVGPLVPPVRTQVLVQQHRCSTTHVVLAWVFAVLTGFYLLPWAVSATRNRSNVAATAAVNLFLGWTLVGWVVALVMACGSDRPVVLVQHTYGPPPQQPWAPAVTPRPARPYAAPEPTMIDPMGSEPTRQLPLAPWEPSHRR